MAQWKHDRVTKYQGANAIVCIVVGLGAAVAAVSVDEPQPAVAVIAGLIAIGFLGLGLHYASVWREKRSTR